MGFSTIRQTWPLLALMTVTLIALIPLQARPQEVYYVGKFSAASPGANFPSGWKPLTFKKIKAHTGYSMVKDEGTVVVKAVSDASASGLICKIRIDPEHYPTIQWRWKTENIYQNGDVTQKSGDDYPARIYITFEYDPQNISFLEKTKFEAAKLLYGEYPPGGAINYIWASKARIGTIVSNPYTDHVKMIVVESGKDTLNTWVTEERNLLNDYIIAFGKKPPMISGIAIMTDSDNTQESAVAYFGDILFKQN